MSKSDYYCYSRLAAPVEYTGFEQTVQDPKNPRALKVKWKVRIEGGAGVANKNLITPKGVVTGITREQLALLKDNQVFKMHVEGGYVEVSEHEADANLVGANLTRDQSSPLTPADFGVEKAPTVGGA